MTNTMTLVGNDRLEYITLFTMGYHGFVTLTSGTEVFVTQPRSTPEEIGLALKKIIERFEKENDER